MDFAAVKSFIEILHEQSPELAWQFDRMLERAREHWLNALSPHEGSYTGYPHIRGVFRNADKMIPDQAKHSFRPGEIFLLLAAILLHDIGKLKEPGRHGELAEELILKGGDYLGLPDERFARYCAVLAKAHASPRPDQKVRDYRDTELDPYGKLRIPLLGAILRIADEAEHAWTRATPVADGGAGQPDRAKDYRRLIEGVEFSCDGRCVVLHVSASDSELVRQSAGDLNAALSKLQDVLNGWAKELSGIGVCYRQAFLEFKGNLYDKIGTDGKLKEKPIEKMVKEPRAKQIARGLRQAIQRLYLGTNRYRRFRWEAVEAEYGRPLDEFGRWVVGRLKGIPPGVTARPAGDGAEIEIDGKDAAPSAPAPGTVNQASSPQELVLSTGCPELNRLLRMGGRPEEKPGILVAAQGAEEPETPVVLIEGQEGTGKTTLALQMAHAALKEGDGCFSVFFYSLEQPASSLRRLAAAFNFAGEDRVWLWDFRDEHEGATRPEPAKSVYLCHLSPLPIRDVPPKPILEARLAEIVHMLERASGLSPGRKPVFFLDSLNALGMSPLERNDVHRLFAMFRSKKIPLVVTSERYATRPEDVPASLEHARFLADVVVSLSREGSGDYQQFYLEILKSRQSRQAFGRHLYKIRTQESALRTSLDPRRGIVVYPSIHSVLSRAWSPPGESGQPAEKRFWVGDDKKDPASNEYLDELLNVVEEPTIKAGACIAIVGPTGTHKLALGMNLAMGNDGTDEGNPKVLVVTFGGSGEIKFEGVAWATTRAALGRELKPVQSAEGGVATALGFEQRKVKFWKRLYTAEATRGQQARRADVTVLAFRVGELAPEECFYVLEKEVKDGGYSSVLLSDTAVLCTGFPLLRDDPVFMAALLDFFEAKGLVSVAIGVEAPQVPKSYELNFALMAKADYRIVLSHYPTVYALAKRIVGGRARSKAQQLSSLVIDNVVGKHYGRELRWLWVEENLKPPEKTLHCGTEPPRAACEQLGLAANSTPQGSAGPSG